MCAFQASSSSFPSWVRNWRNFQDLLSSHPTYYSLSWKEAATLQLWTNQVAPISPSKTCEGSQPEMSDQTHRERNQSPQLGVISLWRSSIQPPSWGGGRNWNLSPAAAEGRIWVWAKDGGGGEVFKCIMLLSTEQKTKIKVGFCGLTRFSYFNYQVRE